MSTPEPERLPDWEAFYCHYRKPGYVPGFEITTKLGGGTFGLVFRAKKQSIGKDYAIKFLQVDDTEVRRAVLLELEQVKYFAQIDHPNLVSIEDRGEVDGIPFLVMSFAGTETLRDRIPTAAANGAQVPTPAEKDDLLRYFLQCCRGLAALHERSLVHFDIKPANVFLKGSVARLGDYGLSKLVTHSRGSLSMGRGTPYYMAPEMLQRRGDHRSDIYSLGVMLYEILCGCVPFKGDSEWEVLRKHEKEAPSLPAHLSGLERAVLQRCLQKDPAARFQSVHDLIAAFGERSSIGTAVGADTAAAQIASAAALGGNVPPCLPPPLTKVGPPPLPERLPPLVREAVVRGPAAAARRGRGAGPIMLLVLVGGLGFLFFGVTAVRSYGTQARLAQVGAQRAAVTVQRSSSSSSLSSKVEQFVGSVQKSMRSVSSRKKSPELQELDRKVTATVSDFAACSSLVNVLARSPSFSPGHAQKLERLGRAAFLAGVSMLQGLDYDEAEHCQRAAILHQFLAHVTAVDGLSIAAKNNEPSRTDSCRFAVVADAWRRFAEQFAASDEDYQHLLVVKGKVGAGVDR
ncbi:MAG: serine/threonine-protein kinase [Planctomycetota bacterium]